MTSMRPTWARYRLYLIAIVPAAILLLALDFLRNRDSLPLFAAVLACTLILVAAYLALFFRNYRIMGELHLLEVHNWLGRSRTLGPDVLDRVVLVRSYTENGTTAPYLMVVDRNGRRVLGLGGRFWTIEQMIELATTLSLPVDALDAQRPPDLRRRYPQAVSYLAAHPYTVGVLLGLGLVILIVAGVVIYVAATYQGP